jgi:hypothetical protein
MVVADPGERRWMERVTASWVVLIGFGAVAALSRIRRVSSARLRGAAAVIGSALAIGQLVVVLDATRSRTERAERATVVREVSPRARPDTSASVRTTLREGDALLVRARSDQWLLVETPADGESGWIPSDAARTHGAALR